ncbi:hypothetical protein JCM10212_001705 [Sporobolomyces blumeae]
MAEPDLELRTIAPATSRPAPASTASLATTVGTAPRDVDSVVSKIDDAPPTNKEAFDSYPEDAWAQVVGGFALFSVTVGGVYTWGVLQDALVSSGIAPSSTVSWIGSTQATIQALLAILMVRLVASFGARTCAIVGSLCIGLGPLLASFCVHSVVGLALTEGLIFGVGQALIFFASSILPSSYFLRRRNIATGIVYAGGGVGGAVLSIIAGKLLQRLSIAWTLRVLALIFTGTALPAALVIKSRAPRQSFRTKGQIFDLSLLRNPSFLCLLFGTSIAIFPLFVPPFFLPLYGTSIGLSQSTSSYLLAGFNLASAGGRIGFGIFADARLGSLNSLILCLGIVAISTLAIWPFATSIPPLVLFAVINGFCAGGMFSLVPGVVSTLFGSSRLGVVFAMLLTSWTPGYFLGSPIAGYLLQAAGGPEGGIPAFRPAILYSGGLSLLSCFLVSAPKILEIRKAKKAARSEL